MAYDSRCQSLFLANRIDTPIGQLIRTRLDGIHTHSQYWWHSSQVMPATPLSTRVPALRSIINIKSMRLRLHSHSHSHICKKIISGSSKCVIAEEEKKWNISWHKASTWLQMLIDWPLTSFVRIEFANVTIRMITYYRTHDFSQHGRACIKNLATYMIG